MEAIKTKFKDLIILKSKNYFDKRGFFREVYKDKILKKKFVFDCISKSKKNVVRGLHFQHKKPQGKFISVLKGEIFDVAVDIRKKSKTFGKHFIIKINERSDFGIFIPPGFAHGFVCLTKECLVYYKCTKNRFKKFEKTMKWNDINLKINWGLKNPILSKKDKNGDSFNLLKKFFR